jgi:NADH:ubiquinone oxidoreductase subunit E
MLRGAGELMATLGATLGVEEGEVTGDGRCSYVHFECLGASEQAPMMMGDDTYPGDLDPVRVRRIVEELD